jgi:hypothetical protein
MPAFGPGRVKNALAGAQNVILPAWANLEVPESIVGASPFRLHFGRVKKVNALSKCFRLTKRACALIASITLAIPSALHPAGCEEKVAKSSLMLSISVA